MIRIDVLAVGSLKEAWLRDGCSEYCKRIGAWAKITMTEINEYRLPKDPSFAQIAEGVEQEGRRILEKLPKGAKTIALCIEGSQMSSEGLAQYMEKSAGGGNAAIAFVIGGSHGLSKTVKAQANMSFSMSPMTFPHQLARVMLCEQVYRALSISAGTKYHK